MFTRFSPDAREAVVIAQTEARSLRHGYLGTEHLLLGIASVEGSVSERVLGGLGIDAARLRGAITRIAGEAADVLGDSDAEALGSLGIDLDEVRERVEETFGPGALDRPVRHVHSRGRCRWTPEPFGHIPFTPKAKKVLELSLRESLRLAGRSVGTEHILLALVRERDGVAARVLDEAGASPEAVRRAVTGELARGIDPPAETA